MGKRVILTEEQERQIIYNYTVLNQGQKTAGNFIPVSDCIVRKVLKKHGIHIKTVQEANVNKYSINHLFFQKQSHDMAYWLGILGSDGCVSGQKNMVYIELQRCDKELLEKLNDTIENERPIKDYENHSKSYLNSKLYFYSRQIKCDLREYHIIPNKTYSQEYSFPEKLEEQYYPDYIRGLFDGDGSIKFNNNYKANSRTIAWQIDTSSETIADTIIEYFCSRGIVIKKSICPRKNIDIYRIYGYGKEKCLKIYNLLYENEPRLFLKRKRDRFMEYLSL